jgi:hypothetical protein
MHCDGFSHSSKSTLTEHGLFQEWQLAQRAQQEGCACEIEKQPREKGAECAPRRLGQRAERELGLGREEPERAFKAGRDAGDEHPAAAGKVGLQCSAFHTPIHKHDSKAPAQRRPRQRLSAARPAAPILL